MIQEYLTAVCDKCLETAGPDPTPYQQARLAFPRDKPDPIYFQSHSSLARTIQEHDWYIDARTLLCPEHHQELIDAQRDGP